MEEKIKFERGDIYISSCGGEKEVISERLVGHIEGDSLNMKLFKRAEDVKKYFSVGDRIRGFCNGFFGRDDYEDKICVAVFQNFAVFQYEDGEGAVLNYPENERCFEDGLFWNHVETWRVD